MQIEDKIIFLKQHLSNFLQKRLNIRIQQKLKKHFSNCKYSNAFNRFYVCSHKQFLKKDSYVLCSQQRCNNCKNYSPRYTMSDKQLIADQFYRDINDPSICGNKQPKIAVLIWVLKVLQDSNKIKRVGLCRKIINRIKNGFACR